MSASHPDRRFSPAGLLAAGVGHVAVVLGLAGFGSTPAAVEPQVLSARLIAPPAPPAPAVQPPPEPVVQPQPKPIPRDRPKPVARARPMPAPPIVAAANREPAEPAAVPEPAPPGPTPAAPAPSPPAASVAAAAPLSAPRFDADYLDNPVPAYPALSRRMREEGRVMLRVFVDADGRPSQVAIKDGSGSPRLDRAAEDAVRRWKFVPARHGDEAVGAWVVVPIVFSLRG